MTNKFRALTVSVALIAATGMVNGQKFTPNYDESKAETSAIPDILAKPDGSRAQSFAEWYDFCRPAAMKVFENEFYGKRPPRPAQISFKTLEESDDALEGIAKRRQIEIKVGDKDGEKTFVMLVYSPKNSTTQNPAPSFICLNFQGNHTTSDDKEILLTDSWARGVKGNKALDEHRGLKKNRWPLKEIVERGYAVATIYYGDIYPDKDKIDGTPESIYTIFDKSAHDLPAISAWSWGLSRGIDALETLPDIDSSKIFVVGHSRLGKTSLLTSACDKRVAIAASNDSGCMGAALSRRNYGETPASMLVNFPFWFSKNLAKYASDPSTMPVDQHQFIAMTAPRPVYVASATQDQWADPRGEFMSLMEASKVYELLGAKKLPKDSDYSPEKPFHGDVGYHLRIGKHDITVYDWMNYCDFADLHFGKQSSN